jgi:hypothetical protein
MGIAEIFAFFKALPELVKVMGEVVSSLKQLRQDSINRELDSIRNEFDTNIKKLTMAVNDEQRKKALLDLNRALGR